MPAVPISTPPSHCIDGGANTTLRISFPPSSSLRDFSWPPLAPPGAAYAFALSRALLVLPAACTSSLALPPNANNGLRTPRDLWLGRLSDLPAALPLPACGCGAAILLSGSAGLTGDSLRHARHLAARGYAVLAPDTMGGGPLAPRRRPAAPHLPARLREARATGYWCADLLYAAGCDAASAGGASPACFSSEADHILYDPAGWAAFYERVFEMRRRETDAVVEGLQATLGLPRRLFLVGVSEGAMVAARYTHPLLPQLGLAGRILTSWSCEFNYFVSCAEHARLAAPPVPVLNLLSAADPYFSPNGSIAARVARPGAGGYGAWPLEGSCASQLRAQRLPGAAFRMLQPYHDQMELAGSFWRHAVSHFLAAPDAAFSAYHSVLDVDSVPLPSSLCEGQSASQGVLSASCADLASFVQPQPNTRYNATACGWPSEEVRPSFVSFDSMPPSCAVSAAPPAAVPSAAGVVAGAALLAFCCGVGATLIVMHLIRRIDIDPVARRIRLS
ncbi:hypothetical protein AB1Y20_012249 [Prymnesium parvum]|uniref:Feruloyl esterase n=1 Tax=Prymnesium parvum TaxID=97485 RepID=A0AB34IN00_PRYPA